ncbi:uncharacterized protein LOC120327849 [Styela clava]
MFAAVRQRFLEDDKFMINYQILVKGVWVIVIYSLEETANPRHHIVEDGYEIVEMGGVRLPRRPRILCLIVSLDDAAEIAPDKKLFSYNDLAVQTSIKHKARLVSTEAGKHSLQLVIASGHNICHEAPFDAVLTIEDLYHRRFSSIDDCLRNLGLGALAPLFKREDILYATLIDMDEEDLKDIGITEEKYRKAIIQATKGIPEEANMEKHRFNPLYDTSQDVSVEQLLQIHDVGLYWALLQSAGVTTVEIFSALDESELKEIGVTAVGDRIRIMRAVKNSRPEFENLIFKTSERFSSIDDCLRNLGLGALAHLFKREDILYATLIDMDEEDLKDIGITEKKYRKAIIQATKGIPEEANMEKHRFNPLNDTSRK